MKLSWFSVLWSSDKLQTLWMGALYLMLCCAASLENCCPAAPSLISATSTLSSPCSCLLILLEQRVCPCMLNAMCSDPWCHTAPVADVLCASLCLFGFKQQHLSSWQKTWPCLSFRSVVGEQSAQRTGDSFQSLAVLFSTLSTGWTTVSHLAVKTTCSVVFY